MNNKNLLLFKINNNTDIYIESTDRIQKHSTRSSSEETIIKSDKNLEELLSKVKPVSELIFNSFSKLNNPNNIEIEMGLKFGAKAGLIFASADSEATFKVTLKWNN